MTAEPPSLAESYRTVSEDELKMLDTDEDQQEMSEAAEIGEELANQFDL